LPTQVRDDEVLETAGVANGKLPLRLHGSFRLGIEETFAELQKTFNLRPSIDELPEEQSLTIEINGRPMATLLCSPPGTAELALGWSFAQGYFDDFDQVQRLTPYGARVSLMIDRPGPGGASWQELVATGFDASAIRSPRTVLGASDDADTDSLRFDQTGFLTIAERIFSRFQGESGADAVHHAAVTDGDHVCAVSRDVCRHNAVDKVIGWSLTQRLERRRLVLCLSGRISADLAYKAIRAGFPIVASSTVPTCEAVELAHSARITLVGRVLEPCRTIYAHPWRLTADDDA
jgi:FdhD protein